MPADRVDGHKHSAATGIGVAWVLGALAVLVQMVTNGRYGYFRTGGAYIVFHVCALILACPPALR